YLADGRGRLQLPAGRYTVNAGRGFEYSLARQEIAVAAGQTAQVGLTLRREVPTEGYVACDTHVHTLTHSGHGDATIEERMLSIAGEGIELPVATDHNLHIDYEALAQKLRVRQHFTPVVGNEVTTGRGHFNVFPVQAGATPPNHKLGTWPDLFEEIVRRTDPAVIVLNHAQDLHSGVRPFGPKLFNAAVAEHQEAWSERLNAMEVVNSGATQTDPLQLFHNWMALLNRGRAVTPIGSSDSHDVGRHFVGQARTYIRCDDRDPGNIPVAEAVDSLRHGRVLVSYGLLAELIVNDQFRSGELVPLRDQPYRVEIRVLGPHWVRARKVQLYANGQLFREVDVPAESRTDRPAGVVWSDVWELPRLSHDVHLVAIAVGPGIEQPYWRTAKPYQPVSPDGNTHVLGCSGAVWLDVDGDGRPTSARDYAERIVADATGDVAKQVAALNRYDAAVAAHVAHLQVQAGRSPVSEEMQRDWRTASPAARTGFQNYVAAWRECELARQPSASENPKAR
ncbi:MAG TPA: CehA/McbA family metallohydrolase, partial [Planctomycetaceae bacterium]|nr:CehA/McbA family metallohydrolase [Planctomycetaceae bacterium]